MKNIRIKHATSVRSCYLRISEAIRPSNAASMASETGRKRAPLFEVRVSCSRKRSVVPPKSTQKALKHAQFQRCAGVAFTQTEIFEEFV